MGHHCKETGFPDDSRNDEGAVLHVSRIIRWNVRAGKISEAIAERLPVSATAMRWGEEIYFDVPAKMANTRPTREVRIGDIAYWPEGPCVCIFFGKTPASKREEPRPASDVTIIGSTDASVTLLRSIVVGKAVPSPWSWRIARHNTFRVTSNVKHVTYASLAH